MKPTLDVCWKTLLAILLAILANAMWELLVSPAIPKLQEATISISNSIQAGYKDDIYRMSARGYNELASRQLLAFITGFNTSLFLAFPVILYRLRNRLKGKQLSSHWDEITNRIGWLRYLFVVAVFASALWSFVSWTKVEYSNSATTYALNSIEILHPYIEDRQAQLLKSQFLRITTAKDFYAFNDELKRCAKEQNIQLPHFEPI